MGDYIGAEPLSGVYWQGRFSSTPLKPFLNPILSVPPPDRTIFTDRETVIGSQFATLAAMVNTQKSDADRSWWGWFSYEWWRGADASPFTYNARHQELVRALALFYTHDAPWNVYKGDTALLRHLVAGLEYWLSLEIDGGGFPATRYGVYSDAAAAFIGEHIGATWQMLEAADAWPSQTLRRDVLEALRRNAIAALTSQTMWASYGGAMHAGVNVVIELMAGIHRMIALYPQSTVDLYHERLTLLFSRMISPAGFMWENRGPSFGYSTNVGLMVLGNLYAGTGDERAITAAQQHAEWMSYNFLYESAYGYLISDGIDTRNRYRQMPLAWIHGTTEAGGVLSVNGAPQLAAFMPGNAAWATMIADWKAQPEPAERVPKPDFGPTTPQMFELFNPADLPDSTAKVAAINTLPYRASSAFTKLLRSQEPAAPDPNLYDRSYLFVRRAGYYMGCAWGATSDTDQYQRYGTRFFFHHTAGTFVLSTRGADGYGGLGTFWGVTADAQARYATTSTIPTDASSFTLTMTAGTTTREVLFEGPSIRVTVTKAGSFTERIPLILRATDVVKIGTTVITDDEATGTASELVVERTIGSTVWKFRVYAPSGTLPFRVRSAAYSNALLIPDRTTRHLEIDASASLVYRMAIAT